MRCNLAETNKIKYISTSIDREKVFNNLDTKLDRILSQDPNAALIYPIILPDRSQDVIELSSQIYNWIIKPIETEIETELPREKSQIKTLAFVLDGRLRNIPASVLFDRQRDRYLIQRYAVAIIPSLQLLNNLDSPPTLNTLLGGLSEERTIEGKSYASLTYVPEELEQIEALVPSLKLIDNTFTKANLKNTLQSNSFPIIHLATHGQFSSDPDETFIILSDERLKANDFNILLQQNKSQTNSPVELLILSACETATGDRRAVLGLAGVSVRLGVPTTIATLWQINDESTTKLTIEFYRQLKENLGINKAEALRQAQLNLWQNTEAEWDLPFYWAAYILVGRWLYSSRYRNPKKE